MTYEVRHTGHARTPRKHERATSPKRTPPPKRTGVGAQRARTARGIRMQPSVTPMIERVPMVASTALADYDGLAFSLKPPKWARKLTIKKVLKPLAIAGAVVGTALAAPVVLPALAHGAVATGGLVARGLVGGSKLVGGAVSKLLGKGASLGKNNLPSSAGGLLTSIVDQKLAAQGALEPSPASTPATPAAAPSEPTAPSGAGTYGGGSVSMPSAETMNPFNYGGTSPTSAGGSLPSAPAATDDTTPQTAGPGAGSNLPLLIAGGVALLLLTRKGRMRRAS